MQVLLAFLSTSCVIAITQLLGVPIFRFAEIVFHAVLVIGVALLPFSLTKRHARK